VRRYEMELKSDTLEWRLKCVIDVDANTDVVDVEEVGRNWNLEGRAARFMGCWSFWESVTCKCVRTTW
jgi:hypothetical protein